MGLLRELERDAGEKLVTYWREAVVAQKRPLVIAASSK